MSKRRDVHSAKYNYNIHYKYILIILRDNGFITSIDESLTQRSSRGTRGRGSR